MSAGAAASPTLKRVVGGGLCSGCGGCAALAPGKILMGVSETGFARPAQRAPLTSDEEARLSRICPGATLRLVPDDRAASTLWGPYVAARTGWASDAGLRRRASSGGALSALLTDLLEKGVVDAIVANASDTENPVANRTVICESPADIAAAAGSRYAPSAPLAAIPALLDDHRRFAFVGKPCDVAALRALADTDQRVADRFPVAVSFFCAGVPSLEGGDRVLAKLGAEKAKVASFRYRGYGWPGRATVVLHDGEERSMTYAESWGGVLSGLVQLRCRICPDGTGHFADIVCADAWETDDNGYPLFEERDGVSLILSRTRKGEDIVRSAMASGAIIAADYDIDALAAIQPGQTSKRRYALARMFGLRLAGKATPRFDGFPLWRNARSASFRALLRNFAGSFIRAMRGRLRH